ncbi:DNA/RNA non-specific endonuclease, partial [Bradyrhizobium sp.]
MSQERTEKARNFLAKLLPGQSLESLDPAAATEAPVLERVSPEHRGTVESATVKLSRGETLNPAEQFAVEAIIIPDKRPAIDIIAGDYNVVHPLWTHFNEAPIKAALRPTFASIGRIELPGNPTVPYGGTGFVVGNGLVMTNRHVAEIFCSGLGVRGLVFRPGYQAGIDFLQEKGSTASQFLQVREVVMIHPYWDMALLRVEGLDAQHPMLALSQGRVEDRAGQDVAVIGYPAFDPRNDVNVQNTVFGGVYYIKRLQPGKLNIRGKIESFGKIVSAVTHDSSTLGGNSGSAVIDPGSGQVVGLHFAGLYLQANYAVPAAELARDPRVVDAGVNFKPAAAPEAGIWNDWWAEADPAEEASETQDTGDDAPAVRRPQAISARSGATVSSRRGPGQSSTWTIPIEITVRIGEGAAAEVEEDSADTTEKMVEPIHDTDYASRTGYDSKFLGLPVPLPEPTDQTVVAHIDDGSYALHYHHFSIVMNKRRRLALFTASNVDASKTAKAPEAGKKFTRGALGGLGKSDVEKWFMDPRIPELHQLPDRFFTKDQGTFDKGHLVRRDDVAWGDSFADVQLANGDTFHTTNCSPQIAKFNRPDQKSNWGELEKFIFKEADRERLCLFAGPVLADDDQTFTGPANRQ